MPHQAIAHANLTLSVAVRSGDAGAIAALYAENAKLLPPGRQTVSGRAAILEFWRGLLQAGLQEVLLTTREVMTQGPLAVEIGSYSIAVNVPGSEPMREEGKYVVVWQLEADGSWKNATDIWNADGGA